MQEANSFVVSQKMGKLAEQQVTDNNSQVYMHPLAGKVQNIKVTGDFIHYNDNIDTSRIHNSMLLNSDCVASWAMRNSCGAVGPD